MGHRRTRMALAVLILISVATLVYGFATAPTTADRDSVPRPAERDNITVVTQSAKHGSIIAWRPNGSLLYYNDSRTKYFDVDRSEAGSLTVEYAAADTIHTRGPTCSSPPCTRNVIERANLSTGHTEEILVRYDGYEHAAEWHDHERLSGTRILVADMAADQVYVVNTSTGIVAWKWEAQSEFPVSGGGPYPDDWAHINDVEALDDGRIMVSLRNQDQVVFIDRQTGVEADWTLGADDDHDVLFEQHNPDYIPKDRGGPAVVVADSENGRVLEYQRVNDSWERSWVWRDDRMRWPRDADRLPNGNTLIADTHGRRVIEIDPAGDIVWSVRVDHPYDVERFGTAPESSGGESARKAGLTSREASYDAEDGIDPLGLIAAAVKAVAPSRLVNAAVYLAPTWMGRLEFLAAGVGTVAILAWIALEVRGRYPGGSVRSPADGKDDR